MEENTQVNLNNMVSADPYAQQQGLTNVNNINNVNNIEAPINNTYIPTSQVTVNDLSAVSSVDNGVNLNTQPASPVAQDIQPVTQVVDNVASNENVVSDVKKEAEPVTVKVIEQAQEEERTFSDNKVLIRVDKLKNLVKQIRNVAICESTQPLSQIIYLRFDMNGFYISGTNTYETVSIIDTKTKYNGILEISVDADLFAKLVSQLDDEELDVTLSYDTNTRILDVVTKGGTFKFPEKIDPATGSSIKIEPVNQNLSEEEKIFNYSELTQALELGKGVRNMAIDVIRGLFLGKYTTSSDRTTALIQPKVFDVGDTKVYYMRSQFVSLLETLSFSESCKYKYIKANGQDINGLYITDGSITITGPLQETDTIDNTFMETYINTNNAKKYTVAREKLAKVMRRTNLFVNSLEDKDYALFILNSTSLKVQTLQGGGSEFIALKTPITFEANISVPAIKILKLLESLKLDELNMSINDDNSLLCIDAENYKYIISLKD